MVKFALDFAESATSEPLDQPTISITVPLGQTLRARATVRKVFFMFQVKHIIPQEERFALIDEFLVFAQAELRFRPESLGKYRSCLLQLAYQLPQKSLHQLDRADLLRIKARFVAKELSDSWSALTILILKRFLLFCRDEKGLSVVDPARITVPKRQRREVVFLTGEEIERFIGSIKLRNADGRTCIMALRFRALVETLLGTALRISEVLSLDRDQINYTTREAKIVGKGGKERIAFFTPRALEWLGKYLEVREDQLPALFADQHGRGRLKRPDIWRQFARHRRLAGIGKRLSAHTLRHTAATQLLFNGCPIGHIKEILGHATLETTCRYYLGVDHSAAKAAHAKYLVYQTSAAEAVLPQPLYGNGR